VNGERALDLVRHLRAGRPNVVRWASMRASDVTTLRTRLLLAIGALTAASLHGGARADTPDEPETVCIPAKATGECPTDEDALEQIRERDPAGCSPYLDKPGGTLAGEDCCYEVRYDCTSQVVGCNYTGRPLLIEGRPLDVAARRLAGWQDARLPRPDLAGLSTEERRLLAFHWARIGAAEYASIAGFQRFAMDLMANGAPADLIVRAQRAALDELRHARLAFTLASAFAGTPIGPGALDLPAAVPIHRSLTELAAATAVEGCTVETLSACLLAEALHQARDPAVIAALTQMRRDEDRHAVLAWQALRWALSQDPGCAGPVDAALKAAITGLAAEGFAHPGGLERFGLLHPSQAETCRTAAIHRVIEPCRAALLPGGYGGATLS
jgi:hypothetical protein